MIDFVMLSNIIAMGLAAGGIAALIRAAPWPKGWKRRKPLGCPTCMGWWTAFSLCGLVAGWAPEVISVRGSGPIALIYIAAVAGIASWLNGQITPPEIEIPGFEDTTP